MKTQRIKNKRIMFTTIAMAMALLLILPFTITPTVSLLAAESPTATNVMAGEHEETPPTGPNWTENSRNDFNNKNTDKWLFSNDSFPFVTPNPFTIVEINARTDEGIMDFIQGNTWTGHNYGIRIKDWKFDGTDGLTTNYKNVHIALIAPSGDKIFLYFKPDPNVTGAIIIREWGSGLAVGKITPYKNGADDGLDILFDSAWMGCNLPGGGLVYTLDITEISGMQQLSFNFKILSDNSGTCYYPRTLNNFGFNYDNQNEQPFYASDDRSATVFPSSTSSKPWPTWITP